MSPNYNYDCRDCGDVQEVFHGMKEKPRIKCAACGSTNVKRCISAPNLIVHGSIRPPKQKPVRPANSRTQLADMHHELREDFNVHTVTPMQSKSFEEVYSDIKEQGGAVKEQMVKKREGEQGRITKKHKDWMKGAVRRTPDRAEKMKKEKKKEAYKKRSIRTKS